MDNDVKAEVCSALGITIDAPSDFNYRKSGTVDSLGTVRLILSLEERFGITFTDDDVRQPEFSTVGGLVAAIERRLQAVFDAR